MNGELKYLIQSIGALSELCGILRDEFIKNDFTRDEAVYLVGVILESVINGKDSDSPEKDEGENLS